MTDVTLSIEKGWAISALEIDYARKPGEPTPQIFLQGVNSRGNIAYTTRMTKAEAGELGAVLLALNGAPVTNDTPIAVEPGQLLLTLRGILADVRAHNGNLNDPEGNGSGDNAQSPTGDDYNWLLELLGPLYALTGECGA